MTDRKRPGVRRRRAGRIALALAPFALLGFLWQPVKGVLLGGLEAGVKVAGAASGLTTVASAGTVTGTGEPTSSQGAGAVRGRAPSFDAEGRLLVPEDYRQWPFAGAAVGLSYSETGDRIRAGHDDPGEFTHVYIEPGAYSHFRDTGEFPEGTTFFLDIHRPATGVSIARGGWFEGERVATHAAVKAGDRFDGGWGYFDVSGDRGQPVRSGACRSCHLEHGAIDSVFVQFYPLLRELSARC